MSWQLGNENSFVFPRDVIIADKIKLDRWYVVFHFDEEQKKTKEESKSGEVADIEFTDATKEDSSNVSALATKFLAVWFSFDLHFDINMLSLSCLHLK